MRYIRHIDSTVLFIATVLLALREQKEFAWLWMSELGRSSWFPLALLALGSFFGIVQPVVRWSERGQLQDRIAMDHQINSAFSNILSRVLDLVHQSKDNEILQPAVSLQLVEADDPYALSHRDIALHIWRAKRTIRHPLVGQLVRLRAIRMASTPTTQPVIFLRGKGVTGACWERNDIVVADNISAHHDVHSQEAWLDVTNSTRRNLSWTEHKRSKHCGAILATPIRSGERFSGCISVDLPYGARILEDENLQELAQQVANRIGERRFLGV